MTFLQYLAPCCGIRETSLGNLETFAATQQQGEAGVLAAADDSKFWASCPRGLTQENNEYNPVLCAYTDWVEPLWHPETPALPADYFEFHSDRDTYFDRDSAALNVSLAFGHEYFDALRDNVTFDKILYDFGLEEIKKNSSFQSEFVEWMRRVGDTAFSDGESDFWADFHDLEHGDLHFVKFLVEEYVIHSAVGGAIVLIHALEVAAAESVLFGELWLERYLGLSLVAAAHKVGHYMHFFLHKVLLPYAIAHGVHLVYEYYHEQWLEKTERVEDFINRLVLRPACAKQRLQDNNDFSPAAINPLFTEVCGANQTAVLSLILERSHLTMVHVFDTIAAMGKCLNPEGEDRRAKVSCAYRLYRPLREQGGKPGQLWTSLVFLSTVMQVTDELLVTPHYKHIMEEKFGVAPPPNDGNSTSFSELSDLDRVKDDTMDKRFFTCYSILATHRAFEMSLSRVAQSLEVWTRTFARRKTAPSFYGISWKPCQKVFNKLADAEAEGFCKSHKSEWSEEQQDAERIACSSPMNLPQWKCHHRTRGQDAMWCQYVGISEGYEYKHFGRDTSGCGCECCTRQNVGSSMWPELESGGGH